MAPHRWRSFKLSNDKPVLSEVEGVFAEKLHDVVGLYVSPPAHAIALSVDEKSQIQALDRTQPGLPLRRGRGATMTHDYKRNGTTTLFAAGTDTIALSGGSATAPVADVTVIEALAMTGGYATTSGNAALSNVDMSDRRLVGLAGWTIAAGQIAMRQGATFGLAGTVNGNLSVAGILSPGASPGTMRVNSNVALASTSPSMFELTPTGAIRPGTSYDLITASAGITGSFTTILKPDSLFGFVVQRADRIQLLGQFLGDASFSPQESRSVAYANSVLTQQATTSPLFAPPRC